MKTWLMSAVLLSSLAGSRPAKAQSPPPEREVGTEARAVFAARCAACHGPDLVKPKGRFGYVLDLRRLAGNPEFVIPGKPDESELWVLVQRDEMPPSDSPHGPLSQAEKAVVRDWIAAGAPGGTDAPEAPDVSQATPTVSDPLTRAVRGLGKFHLLLLHFPIALVLAAGVGEAWRAWQGNRLPAESVRFCLWLGALLAVPTAGLGWLFAAAGNGVGSPDLLTAHRWLGTAAAVWLLVTAVAAERGARRRVRSRRVRLLLAAGVLLTALTAHLGGLLAHGADFFTQW